MGNLRAHIYMLNQSLNQTSRFHIALLFIALLYTTLDCSDAADLKLSVELAAEAT